MDIKEGLFINFADSPCFRPQDLEPSFRRQYIVIFFSGKSWRPCQTRASITSASLLVIGLGRFLHIKIGYWTCCYTWQASYWTWQVEPGEPFPKPILDDTDTSGALYYLKRLLVWLDQLGMKANIDLHGAPGSQNGFEIFLRENLPSDLSGLTTAGGPGRQTG